MKKTLHILILITALFVITACSTEKRPFEAQYTSRNSVIITYQGQKYFLNRFTPTAGVPFDYSFERDGDLNLVINGKDYEVDSPYDRDKKKKIKKTVKKKIKKKK